MTIKKNSEPASQNAADPSVASDFVAINPAAAFSAKPAAARFPAAQPASAKPVKTAVHMQVEIAGPKPVEMAVHAPLVAAPQAPSPVATPHEPASILEVPVEAAEISLAVAETVKKVVSAEVSAVAKPAPMAQAKPAPMAPPENVEKTIASLKNGVAGTFAGIEKTQAEVIHKMEKAYKTAEELVTFGQGNIEAFVKSSQIWAAGIQDISKQFAASAQSQFEASFGTFKALSSVKSIKEAVELQTTLVRDSLEKTVAETTKLTDASMRLAEQALAPLTARVTLVAEKFTPAV